MSDWPSGLKCQPIVEWPGAHTARRQASRFDSTLGSTQKLLERELRELGAKDVILQIAVPREKFRIDGRPYADAKPTHPGVILTMSTKHGALSYPCDNFTTWQDNLRAIALSLEALRMVDRYRVTRTGEQYRGFLAIESFAMPAGIRFESIDDAIEKLQRVAAVEQADAVVLASLLRRAKFRSHPDTIAPENHPEDYDLVLAAEQYLKTQGVIS